MKHRYSRIQDKKLNRYGSCNFQRWLVTIPPYTLVITWYSFLIALTKRVLWRWHYWHLMLVLNSERGSTQLSHSLPVSLSGCLLLELRLHALRKPKPHGQTTRRYSGLSWGSAYWSALTTGHGWGNFKGDFNPSHGDRHHIKEPSENHLAEIGQWLELWCVRSCSATSAVSKPLQSNGL